MMSKIVVFVALIVLRNESTKENGRGEHFIFGCRNNCRGGIPTSGSGYVPRQFFDTNPRLSYLPNQRPLFDITV